VYIIKPRDLVRLPNGHTAEVLDLTPDGCRRVRDLKTREELKVPRDDLFLVCAAKPLPWRDRVL